MKPRCHKALPGSAADVAGRGADSGLPQQCPCLTLETAVGGPTLSRPKRCQRGTGRTEDRAGEESPLDRRLGKRVPAHDPQGEGHGQLSRHVHGVWNSRRGFDTGATHPTSLALGLSGAQCPLFLVVLHDPTGSCPRYRGPSVAPLVAQARLHAHAENG